MSGSEAARPDDPAFLRAVLEALPAGAFLLGPDGTIRYCTDAAAALVERAAGDLVGTSVLELVDEETAWTYAAAVAMASDFPERVTGPMRITVVTPAGAQRRADLWAYNRLDDPVLAGIVCLLTPESAAGGLGEALQALAGDAALPAVATRAVQAMAGHPVVADAALVAVGPSGWRRVDEAGTWMPELDGPWGEVAASGIRFVGHSLDDAGPALAQTAAAAGYATVWVEPVGLGPPPARGALVLWRQRPGRPSPNQLNVIHQAAAILALAWDRHDRSS